MHNFNVLSELKEENGKTNSEIIWALLSTIFDREQKVLEENLKDYLDELIKSNNVRMGDFGDGIARVIQNMPESTMDYPLLPEYLW